jgi:hypothetical protein
MSISIFGFTQGLKKTVPVNLTDNTVTTIIDSDPTATPPVNANGFDLVGVRVVNKHSAAVTVSLDMFDGTTSYPIAFTENIDPTATPPVRSYSVEFPIRFERNFKLRATSGNASGLLTIFATYIGVEGRTQ